MIYYMPLALAVIANLFYHISQKYTSGKINPFFSLFVTYFTAMVVTAVLFLLYKHENTIRENIKELNWSAVVLGIAIVLLEAGWLWIYRVGWNISIAQIIANVFLAMLLIPTGVFFFRESINPVKIIGIGVCLIGVVLVGYSKG